MWMTGYLTYLLKMFYHAYPNNKRVDISCYDRQLAF